MAQRVAQQVIQWVAQETQLELRKVNANPGFWLSEVIVILRCLAEGEGTDCYHQKT